MSTNSEHSLIIAIVKAKVKGRERSREICFLNFIISGNIFFKCVNVDIVEVKIREYDKHFYFSFGDNEDEPSPVFLRADC